MKMPTISVSVDHTKQIWRDYYENLFKEPDINKLPTAPNIDNVDTSNPILIDVDQWTVEEALKKCKKGSSAGHTGITYSHLQSAFNADPIYFTKMIERILNNHEYDDNFSKINIVPIYKTSKKLPTDNPKG
jgi:hypothetical protein